MRLMELDQDRDCETKELDQDRDCETYGTR